MAAMSNGCGITRRCRPILLVLALTSTAVALISPVTAENSVDLTAALGDTLWGDFPTQIIISIGNDNTVAGLSMGFHIFSPDGATWSIDAAGGFYTVPFGSPDFITGIPGSRWMSGEAPDGSCWDMGGTSVTLGASHAHFLIGGSAMGGGLRPGPLQAMLEVHLTPNVTPGGFANTLCIDSIFFPPIGDFIFNPGGVPTMLWPAGGRCWPVLEYMPGDADHNGTVNLADAMYIYYYIFRFGSPPQILNSADTNGDCSLNIGDVIYVINYIFKGGPPPIWGCLP
jgi:hypothetical protein